ncbi:hypothetical protein ABMC88_00380 [Sulfitobacter sp. HNIBRBA2951]|uniref:hypothetical protein n=1 Tax=Sulfitobacter aquimarinus TaxID=3158557 RepID=UPI0032DFADDE
MVYTKEDFQSRLKGVDRKKSKMLRRRFSARVDNNGVIFAKPKARRLSFPLKGIVFMVLGFLCLKALMLSANGPDAYSERLATLENGNVVEAMGARVLSVDPATQFIADKIGPMFR